MDLNGNEGSIIRPLPMTGEAEDRKNKQEWHPTHLHVTVLRACSLRSKGTVSSPYVVIQLHKQKFRTSIASRSLDPEWHEECLLQLPNILSDSEEHSLTLTVMHQPLHYFKRFLGRVSLPLAQLFQDKTKRENEWFALQSRHGKKEKTRGQLQLDIQFLQISSPSNEASFGSSGPWSLFTRICGRRKGSKYKTHKGIQSHSSSMTNEEDSSSSSINTELEISAAKSGPKLGSLPIVAAATVWKPASATQLQKLPSYNYQELSSETMNLTACSPYISQSEHPSTLEQFGSIFTQPLKKKSQPLKEEMDPEAAGITTEARQASLPPLPAAGPRKIPPRAKTLHFSSVSLHQTTSSPNASSAASRFRRCQLQLHRGYHSCLRCFGLGS